MQKAGGIIQCAFRTARFALALETPACSFWAVELAATALPAIRIPALELATPLELVKTSASLLQIAELVNLSLSTAGELSYLAFLLSN